MAPSQIRMLRPKGDLARAGADRLALQEEQDEASIRP